MTAALKARVDRRHVLVVRIVLRAWPLKAAASHRHRPHLGNVEQSPALADLEGTERLVAFRIDAVAVRFNYAGFSVIPERDEALVADRVE